MEDNIKMHERMAKVETNVDTMMTNCIPTVQKTIDKVDKKVDKVDARLWWILGAVIMTSLIGIALKLFL